MGQMQKVSWRTVGYAALGIARRRRVCDCRLQQ